MVSLTRIQLQRKRGWRVPPKTKVCCRPLALSNPFKLGDDGTREEVLELFEFWGRQALTEWTEDLDDRQLKFRAAFEDLKLGRIENLGCFCPPAESCHVDVIIKLFKEYYRG